MNILLFTTFIFQRVIFQHFILTSGQNFWKSCVKIFHFIFFQSRPHHIILFPFYYSPFYETSPSIIAAIKTKARHFPLIQTLTICLVWALWPRLVTNNIGKHFLLSVTLLHNAEIWFDLNIRVNRSQTKTCCKKVKNPVVWRLRIVWILKSFLRCILQTRAVPLAAGFKSYRLK